MGAVSIPKERPDRRGSPAVSVEDAEDGDTEVRDHYECQEATESYKGLLEDHRGRGEDYSGLEGDDGDRGED